MEYRPGSGIKSSSPERGNVAEYGFLTRSKRLYGKEGSFEAVCRLR